MRQILALLLTPFFLFCTSVPPEAVPPDYLVTQITVTGPHAPAPLSVSDQQSMGQILQYLRTVPLGEKTDNPSMNEALPLYTLRLTHVNGRVTEYRQLGAEYLAKNNSPWYHIDPEQGGFLISFFDNTLYNG